MLQSMSLFVAVRGVTVGWNGMGSETSLWCCVRLSFNPRWMVHV